MYSFKMNQWNESYEVQQLWQLNGKEPSELNEYTCITSEKEAAMISISTGWIMP